jgi:Bacterial SH3 domain
MLKTILRIMWLVCLMTGTKADQGFLSGEDIRDLVAGASVEIDTPIGTKLPVRYAPDGQLSGQAEQLAFYLGASTDRGRWWITSDQLCHRWSTWFNSEPQCLRLKTEGRRIRWWTQGGTSGTAVITARPVETAQLPRTPSDSPSPSTPARSQPLTAPAAARPEQPVGSPQVATTGMGVVAAAPLPAPHPAATSPKPKLAAPSTPEPKRSADPTYKVANVERDDVLNVRSGPSTEFDVIAELAPDTRGVSIIGACRADWCPVQHHAASGWVNRNYLALDAPRPAVLPARHEILPDTGAAEPQGGAASWRDPSEAPRACLTFAARALLEHIEAKFGPVRVVSTCRPGALIAGTGRPSRHASGNAVDFEAGDRKAEIVEWLVANHHEGGTMTYAAMSHIHVDIGPHFVAIAGGQQWASWRRP